MKVDKDLESFQDEIDNAIEQQKEAEATVSVTDNITSLNSIAATIHDDVGKLESLVGEVKSASTIHLSDQNKTDMEQCGKGIATAAANEFNTLVSTNVEKLKQANGQILIPILTAYILFIVFVSLIVIYGLVIFLNLKVIHSELINEVMINMTSVTTVELSIAAFGRYRDWW